MATKTYTYIDFATDVIDLIDNLGGADVDDDPTKHANIRAKAEALLATQTRKAEYNATHPKKSTAKGASEKTMNMANAIATVLGADPLTGAEIATALGMELTALQVANACKYIEGVQVSKVIRNTITKSGLKAQKEYTAYSVR